MLDASPPRDERDGATGMGSSATEMTFIGPHPLCRLYQSEAMCKFQYCRFAHVDDPCAHCGRTGHALRSCPLLPTNLLRRRHGVSYRHRHGARVDGRGYGEAEMMGYQIPCAPHLNAHHHGDQMSAAEMQGMASGQPITTHRMCRPTMAWTSSEYPRPYVEYHSTPTVAMHDMRAQRYGGYNETRSVRDGVEQSVACVLVPVCYAWIAPPN